MSVTDVIRAALRRLQCTRLTGFFESFAALAIVMIGVLAAPSPAHALEAIVIGQDQERIDITLLGELYEGRGDRISVETAAGRMACPAACPSQPKRKEPILTGRYSPSTIQPIKP